MKTLYAILILLGITQLSASELSWVDEQVEAIKPPRSGISSKEIRAVKDPFIFLVKKDDVEGKPKKSASKKVSTAHYVKKSHTKRLVLNAILNKSAMINKKWYKEGDKVYGYKLAQVNTTSVVLKRQNKQLLLSTASKSKNLKFHNK